jgi:hypothetical protein
MMYDDAQLVRQGDLPAESPAAGATVALHAYVLMGNHIHLLATPRVGWRMRCMQGNNYVQAFGVRMTALAGRFHSSM